MSRHISHDVVSAERAVDCARAVLASAPYDRFSFTKLIASLDLLAAEYVKLDEMAEAISLFEQSMEARRRVAQMVPEDVEMQCLLSFGLAQLADAHEAAGNFDDAESI